MRPSIPLNTRSFGTKGLAKTKENFPALGGSNSNTVMPPPSAPSTSRRDAATALFKNPPKPTAKVKSNQSQPPAAKSSLTKSVVDFPSLPGASGNPLLSTIKAKPATPVVTPAKTKSHEKTANAKTVSLSRSVSDFPSLTGDSKNDLQTDFIESSPSFSMATVSAKHRALVPSYESVSGGQSGSKINTIQRVETTKPSSANNVRAPVINSKANFPALGNASASAAPAPQWLAAGQAKSKKPTQMSKKLKVAPAPLLEQTSTANSINKQKPEEKSKSKNENKKDDGTTDSKKSSKKEKKNVAKADNGENVTPKPKGKEKSNESKENHRKNGDNKKNSNGPLVSQNGCADWEVEGATTSNGGTTKPSPPPGFSSGSSDSMKPPPGFTATTTKSNATAYEYTPPSNATQRNQILVSYFQKALKTPEAVEQFRNISKLFREDMCTALAFYEHCEATLAAQFHSIFPELLILLPDIKKQQVNMLSRIFRSEIHTNMCFLRHSRSCSMYTFNDIPARKQCFSHCCAFVRCANRSSNKMILLNICSCIRKQRRRIH